MAEKEVAIKLKLEGTGEASKSLSELKKEFKEQQKELEKLAVGSKEYIEQLKKVDSVKSSLNDLKKEQQLVLASADKFKVIGAISSSIAGGFTAATGAASLFGAQSKDVEEAMLKVQSALALQQGIESIKGLGDAFKGLKTIILANPIFALATAILGIVTAFVGLEDIMAGIKIAFNAIGEAAVAVFDGIVDGVMFAIDLSTQFLDLLTFGLLGINDSYKGYVNNIEAANEAERKRIEGLKEEEKQINKNIEQITKQISAVRESFKAVEEKQALVTKMYDAEIRLLRAAGKDTEEAEGRKLEAVREAIKEKIRLKIEEFELEQRLIEEQAKRAENVAKQGSNLVAIGNKQFTEDLKKRSKETSDFIKSLNDELFENQLQIDEKNLAQQKEAYDKWKEQEEKKTAKAKEEAEKRAAFEKAVLKDLREVESKDSDEKYEEYLQSKVDIGNAFLGLVAQTQQKLAEQNSKSAQDELDKQKQLNEFRLQAATDTLQTLSNLAQVFAGKSEEQQKKAFKVQKAINIANAVIDTYKAANVALASAPPPFNFVAAAAAITAGLLNVKNIASTQFDSGASASAGSSAAPSVPSVGAPSTGSNNQINTTLLDREAIESGQQQQEPIQVYVTESDISQTQRRVNGIMNRATVR